jgi:hypothetical protein
LAQKSAGKRNNPNPRFGDQDQQRIDGNRIVRTATVLLPGDPDLYRLFEAQLSRDLIGQQGGLRIVKLLPVIRTINHIPVFYY